MKLKIFLVIFLGLAVFALSGQKVSLAQEEDIFFEAEEGEPEEIPGTVNCFDYYDFGSVKINIGPQAREYTAGQQAVFSGQLTNTNFYPIVNGALFVRVSRVETDQAKQRFFGNHIIDEFFAEQDISIDKGAAKNISFIWLIPPQAKEGDYQLDFFFTVDKKFNLAGLPFTNEIIGGSTNFEVASSQKTAFYFDRSETKVNEKTYYHIGQWPLFEPGSQVNISQPLVNETDQAKTFQVSYEAYWWDTLKEEDKLNTQQEEITIAGGATEILTYQIDSLDQPVTALKIKAQSGLEQAVVNLRVTTNTERPRLNYFGLTKFPLKKGDKPVLFACLHNTAGVDTQGRARIQLLDKDDKLLTQIEYEGRITSAMLGLAKDISARRSLDFLKIKAELFDKDERLVDSSEQIYDCSKFQPDICLQAKKIQPIYFVIIGILIVIILVIVILLIKNRPVKKQETLKSLLLLFLGLAGFAGLVYFGETRSLEQAKAADAWESSQSTTVDKDYTHSWGPWSKEEGPRTISMGNISVEHHVSVNKDSSEVSKDDEIVFTFQPADPSLSAYGGYWDTPWGRWINGDPGQMVLENRDESGDHRLGQWHTTAWEPERNYDSNYQGENWPDKEIMECPSWQIDSFDTDYCGGRDSYQCPTNPAATCATGENSWVRYEFLQNEWLSPDPNKPGAVAWGCWKPEVSVSSKDDNEVIECSGMNCQAKAPGTATLTVEIKSTTCRIFSIIESKREVNHLSVGDIWVPWLWWPSDVKTGEKGPYVDGIKNTNRLDLPAADLKWEFTVLSVNTPPVAYDKSVSTEKGERVDFVLTGSDADENTLEFIRETNVEHGTLHPDKYFPDNGKIGYTPDDGYTGSDSFDFKVNDGTVDSNIAAVSITVKESGGPNMPPTASNPRVIRPDWCKYGPNEVSFEWEFNDPDGDEQKYYRVQAATDRDFNNLILDTPKIESSSNTVSPDSHLEYFYDEDVQFEYNQIYYWRVMVWDDDNDSLPSEWLEPHLEPYYITYNTPDNHYPIPAFRTDPDPPESSLTNPVTFIDQTDFDDDKADEERSLDSWEWEIPPGALRGTTKEITHTFTNPGEKRVSLRAEDSRGYACTIETTIDVGAGPPWWQEIWPF